MYIYIYIYIYFIYIYYHSYTDNNTVLITHKSQVINSLLVGVRQSKSVKCKEFNAP